MEDIGTRAYAQLIEYVATNNNYFISYNNKDIPRFSEIKGKIESEFIIIPKSIFENIMKSLSFESTMPILKIWKEQGLILYNESEKRFTKRKKLIPGGDNISCYFIYRPKNDTLDTPPKKLHSSTKPNSKTTKNELKVEECTDTSNSDVLEDDDSYILKEGDVCTHMNIFKRKRLGLLNKDSTNDMPSLNKDNQD